MQLFDIYQHKKNGDLIQINGYATHMGEFPSLPLVVVFDQLEWDGYEYRSCPSFKGYGTSEEIESEYDLLVPQEERDKYDDWEEIFKIAESKREVDEL